VCKECHQDQFNAWRDSHHAWALRAPSAENVLANFDNTVFEHKGVNSRFFRRDQRYFVETAGPDGKATEYEIKYTVGVSPLQQYLIQLDKGRLQVFDVVWDVERKRWYHLYPDQDIKANDGLHWTGPYKNWQARCAECHQTNFVKGYDPQTKAYDSKWAGPSVGCESCHGPGAAHVAWAKEPGNFLKTTFDHVDDKGMVVGRHGANAANETQMCATCHSRREPLGANSPPFGEPFADHYSLALLRDGLYYADGQIDGEVYVYGSFLQSKMNARGVRCGDCHDPHSTKLVAAGNVVCTQCHSSAGNPKYPSLNKSNYDDEAHHHHKAGSPGAQCVSCHMPAKNYMVIDARRDHSFRVPRPDLSVTLGTPNACATCHDDKPAQWAANNVQQWYPNGRSGSPHFAAAFSRARSGDYSAESINGLISVALDTKQSAIVRATALDLLRPAANQIVVTKIIPLLEDSSDLIRAATVRLFRDTPGQVRYQWVGPLVADQRKSVRIAAARELLNIPSGSFPPEDRARILAAIREYQRSLLAKADFPETQMSIAGVALVLRNTKAAEGALKTALSMDPQLGDAWHMLARVQLAERRLDDARQTLEQGIKHLPDAGPLHHALGNALARQGQDRKALTPLVKAAALMPRDVGAHIDLAAILTRLKQHRRASEIIDVAERLAPENPDVLALRATNLLNRNRVAEARDAVKDLVRRYPKYRLTPQLRALAQLGQ
jgi:predicted CXXCH cytochrome family protein